MRSPPSAAVVLVTAVMGRRGGDWMLKICCVSHDSCAGVIQTTVPVVLFDTVDVKDDLTLFSDLFRHRQFCLFC